MTGTSQLYLRYFKELIFNQTLEGKTFLENIKTVSSSTSHCIKVVMIPTSQKMIL